MRDIDRDFLVDMIGLNIEVMNNERELKRLRKEYGNSITGYQARDNNFKCINQNKQFTFK